MMESVVNDKKLRKIGVLGALFAGLLCTTFVIAFSLGLTDLSAWAVYADVFLVPLSAGLALVVLFLRLRKKE